MAQARQVDNVEIVWLDQRLAWAQMNGLTRTVEHPWPSRGS